MGKSGSLDEGCVVLSINGIVKFLWDYVVEDVFLVFVRVGCVEE